MPPDTQTRLRHMRDAAATGVRLCAGRSRADLDVDETLALAVTRVLEVLGEAAKGVPSDVRSQAPAIPWRQLAGTRDRLIHGYFDVDHDIIWAIVSGDLPRLIADLDGLLAEFRGQHT